MLLLCPPPIQDAPAESPEILRKRLGALYQSGQWTALADAFEALSPAQRGQYLGAWIESLEKAQRWERLDQVCGGVIPQLDPAKQTLLLRDLQRKRLSALTKLGKRAEALALCEILGDAEGAPLYYLLGTDQARLLRDWPAMERLALKWQARKPEDELLPSVLGEALARQDRFSEAEPLLRKAVTLQPKDADAWSNLGRCLNDRKAWPDALEALDKALALNPQHVEAHYNRGCTTFEQGRYRESVEDFQAALAQMPADPVLERNLQQAQRYLTTSSKANKNKK